jgi:polyisoprenoid-binding protein YceI
MLLRSLAITILVAAGVSAEVITFQIDGPHSSANFAVKHMMVTTVRGNMGRITGTVAFDPAKPTEAKVEATVDVKGVNTNDAKRDAHLRSADFFEVEKYPTMTFVSKSITAAGPGKLKMAGDLTIKGVTKQVVFDVEGPAPPVKLPNGLLKSGASATTTINRKDFGVNYSRLMDNGGLVVADEVTITIDVELNSAPSAAK